MPQAAHERGPLQRQVDEKFPRPGSRRYPKRFPAQQDVHRHKPFRMSIIVHSLSQYDPPAGAWGMQLAYPIGRHAFHSLHSPRLRRVSQRKHACDAV